MSPLGEIIIGIMIFLSTAAYIAWLIKRKL
jgi:hypothetical protein